MGRIDDAQEKYFKMLASRTSATKSLTASPQGSNFTSSKIETLTISLDELAAKIVGLELALKLCRNDLYNILSQRIDDPETVRVMYLYYGFELSCSDIKNILKISRRKTFYLRSKGAKIISNL